MTTIGLYTATENELGAVGEAAERLARTPGAESIELSVRSKGDLDGDAAIGSFLDELAAADAAVLWLHGGPERMPGYERVVERLDRAGVA